MRIALVLSGGGSLGSYVAGACSELLSALERNGSGEDIVIDVITATGASCLTAAVAARSVAVNQNLPPWIERCWVEAMDARHLSGGEASGPGRGALEEISRALIAADPASDDRPMSVFDGELRLGICGITGARDFLLTAETGAGDPVWEDIRQAALEASGLPPALPTVSVRPAGASGADGAPGAVALALARRLAARADDADDLRLFIGIDPAVGLLNLNGTGLPEMEGSTPGASGGDARLLDALIARLPEIVDRLDDPGAVALGRHLGDLAERAAELEAGAARDLDADEVIDLIDASMERIEADERLAPILARASSRSGRTRLAKLIYVLRAACASQGAAGGATVVIAPSRPESLACRSFGGLGGFLSEELREEDFRAGRRDARDTILGSLSEWIDYRPDDEAAYLAEATPVGLGPREEAKLRSLVEAAVERELADVRVGGLAGLFGGWKNALKKHAADRALSYLRDEISRDDISRSRSS